MSLGPILIFDKSFLESLSVDESCWLDNFFLTNITPLFYVETLADLEKRQKGGRSVRTPEEIVEEMAIKTPAQGSYPNVHHFPLLIHDLLGDPVEMGNRPILARGEPRVSPDGKVGVHFNLSPEARAFERWQKGEFLELEREVARTWRHALSNSDFDSTLAIVKNVVPPSKRFSDLQQIKTFVDEFVEGKDGGIFYLALQLLGASNKARQKIVERWKHRGQPSLKDFAPYAAYVFRINLFFFLGMTFGFISKDRPTNMVDLAYLYYLPFCMVFVSSDRLHTRTAPLFMEHGQVFVTGRDLKQALKQLDDCYSKLPNEVKTQGIIRFATYPPEEIDTLVSRLWDKFLPIWRRHAEEKRQKEVQPSPPDAFDRRLNEIKEHMKDENEGSRPFVSERPVTADEAAFVVFKRRMHVRKGKWRLLPPEAEKAQKADS